MESLFVCEDLSRVMRKPTFCICENKDADQLRGNREADQRLCFRYTDSAIPRLSKPKISCLSIFSSCTAWFVSDQVRNQNVGFLMTRLICFVRLFVLRSQSTIFQLCRDGATASLVLPVLSGIKLSCSRTPEFYH